MTLSLLGKKLGMTRIYDEAGTVIPVTVVQAGPCPVLQIKRRETDGYTAVQIGFGEKPERKATKAELGHFKKAGAAPRRFVREFRIDDAGAFEVGKNLDVEMFSIGERVDVIGVSKGRGFAGTIKRHHTTRGPETHGSMYHRRPGSMGASSDPSHVWKGKVGAGRLGNSRVTTQFIKVVGVDKEKNILLLRGSVPGHENQFVVVAKSKKAERRAQRKKK